MSLERAVSSAEHRVKGTDRESQRSHKAGFLGFATVKSAFLSVSFPEVL